MFFSSIVRGRLPLLLLLLLGCASPSFAVDFLANWQYRANGGEGIDTQSQLQQRYTLLLGPSLEYQPTHALSAGANLSYSRSEQDLGRGQGRETVETISPGGNLSLTNDIFRASLSGLVSENRRSAGTAFESRSWDATLGSAWVLPFFPSLQLNYSEREDLTVDGDAADGFHDRDTTSGLSVSWDLVLAKLFYDFSRSRRESVLEDIQTDSTTHFARAETGGTAWQKRINFNLAQQFISSTSDQTENLEGTFLSALTDPALPSDAPEFLRLALNGNPLLSDGNLLLSAVTVPDPTIPSQRRVHLGASFNLRQQIQEVLIHIDPVGAPPGILDNSLTWDLFTRDLPDSDWVLEFPITPEFISDGDGNRIVLNLGNIIAREIMVVATIPDGSQLTITELVAARPADQGGGTRTTSLLTSFNTRVQLTPTLSANTGVTLERVDSESGDLATESRRRSVNGSLSWRPVQYVVPSVSFSEARDTQTAAPALLSRTYALTVATYPLPTLNVTLGTTRTDRYEDERRMATALVYSLTSTARIYPDLNAALLLNLSDSERRDDLGGFVGSRTINSRLNLNARLRPTLIADLTGNYRTTESEGAAGTSSIDTTASLGYRPSALLLARLTHTRFWTGPDVPDVTTLNVDLGLVRTQNTQLSLRYTHLLSDVSSDRFGLNGSWVISRNLSFQTRADYTLAERGTWRIDADLTLRL